jgi:hypothetical protein
MPWFSGGPAILFFFGASPTGKVLPADVFLSLSLFLFNYNPF